MYQETLEKWHQMLDQRDPTQLPSLLSEEVVFYSPVVFTPQRGKRLTTLYLSGAFQVLVCPGHFEYVNMTYNETSAVLEFVTRIDGIEVNGVDIIHFDQHGLIKEFKVMVRPLKAIHILQEHMGRLLETLEQQRATKA